jgi:pimeloyl-ACP methyl ester carboxylesterase
MTLWTSIEEVVGRVPSPTLLVLGNSDPVYGEPYQRRKMVPFLKNVQTSALSAGHFIPLECSADLARLITQYGSSGGA